jgi:hypothetical protein
MKLSKKKVLKSKLKVSQLVNDRQVLNLGSPSSEMIILAKTNIFS